MKRSRLNDGVIGALLLLMLLSLGGCSLLFKRDPNNRIDPYEDYNRRVFHFNMCLDRKLFRPVAKTYATLTPGPINQGVSNFFNNLGLVPTIANDVLQAHFHEAFDDSWRLILNSTFGLLGAIDVASRYGFPAHENDLGLTMARWGAHKSPYVMIPFFGPSTYRDSISYPVNYYLLTAWPYIKPIGLSYGLYALQEVDMRASLLPADKLLKTAFDPYIFVRNAYLQKRQQQVNHVLRKEETDEEEIEELEKEDALA